MSKLLVIKGNENNGKLLSIVQLKVCKYIKKLVNHNKMKCKNRAKEENKTRRTRINVNIRVYKRPSCYLRRHVYQRG